MAAHSPRSEGWEGGEPQACLLMGSLQLIASNEYVLRRTNVTYQQPPPLNHFLFLKSPARYTGEGVLICMYMSHCLNLYFTFFDYSDLRTLCQSQCSPFLR